MNFFNRLRDAAHERQRGIPPQNVIVRRDDLLQMVRSFDSADGVCRKIAAENEALRYAVRELTACVDEYRAMPESSLQRALFNTSDRLKPRGVGLSPKPIKLPDYEVDPYADSSTIDFMRGAIHAKEEIEQLLRDAGVTL